MISAEHRRPLAAFLMVFAAACLILGQGLRDRVVEVFVGSGAPRTVVGAIAPDTVLHPSLDQAPKAPAKAVAVPGGKPASSLDEVVRQTVSRSLTPVSASTGGRPRSAPSAHRPAHAVPAVAPAAAPASPAAPVVPAAVPVAQPVKPAATPVPTRPGTAFTGTGQPATPAAQHHAGHHWASYPNSPDGPAGHDHGHHPVRNVVHSVVRTVVATVVVEKPRVVESRDRGPRQARHEDRPYRDHAPQAVRRPDPQPDRRPDRGDAPQPDRHPERGHTPQAGWHPDRGHDSPGRSHHGH
ncbi:MAG: hypothetical protein JWR90_2808 [Marmoricola sp.]|jgi:hypothetical protein|nr:hypothetical protein [Marmoricola sp.]